MRSRLRYTLLAMVVITAIMVVISNDETPTTHPDPILDSQQATQASGMTAHIDPVTGEFTEAPPGDAPALGTNGSDVEVVQEPAPGGGVMVVVGDKFHQSMVATADDSGSVVAECVPKDQTSPDNSTSGSAQDERR